MAFAPAPKPGPFGKIVRDQSTESLRAQIIAWSARLAELDAKDDPLSQSTARVLGSLIDINESVLGARRASAHFPDPNETWDGHVMGHRHFAANRRASQIREARTFAPISSGFHSKQRS